jgi:hypothetical protein
VPWPAVLSVALYLPGIVLWAVYSLRCKASTFVFLTTVAPVAQDTVDGVTNTVNTTLITLAAGGTFIMAMLLVLAVARSLQISGVSPRSACPCGTLYVCSTTTSFAAPPPLPFLSFLHQDNSRQPAAWLPAPLQYVPHHLAALTFAPRAARPTPSSYYLYRTFNMGFNIIVFFVNMAIVLLMMGAFLWLVVAYAANVSIKFGVRCVSLGAATLNLPLPSTPPVLCWLRTPRALPHDDDDVALSSSPHLLCPALQC